MKAAQWQDLYQIRRGSSLIAPSIDQQCNLAEGNEDAPEKSTGFTLSFVVHKQRFMVPSREGLFHSVDCHSDCVDTKHS